MLRRIEVHPTRRALRFEATGFVAFLFLPCQESDEDSHLLSDWVRMLLAPFARRESDRGTLCDQIHSMWL